MKRQAGFSPILGIIVTSILGLTTMVAVDSYSDYTQRAVISTGLQLADDLKKEVSVYVASTGRFPRSNADIEMPDGEALADGGIRSLAVGSVPVDGTITVSFRSNGALSDGDTLNLVPSVVGNRVKWYCKSDTIITDLLPEGCRS